MGLPWIRFDTAFPRNPKLIEMIMSGSYAEPHRSGFVYTCSLLYCGEQGTDGFIPRGALSLIHGNDQDATNLVTARLWHADRKGWLILDWADYNQTSEQLAHALASKRVGALKGNCVRWHGPDCHCWKHGAG